MKKLSIFITAFSILFATSGGATYQVLPATYPGENQPDVTYVYRSAFINAVTPRDLAPYSLIADVDTKISTIHQATDLLKVSCTNNLTAMDHFANLNNRENLRKLIRDVVEEVLNSRNLY